MKYTDSQKSCCVKINSEKSSNGDIDKTTKDICYVCIDNINYAIPKQAEFVFICKRGFLNFVNNTKGVEKNNDNNIWTVKNKTLHSIHPKLNIPWPVQVRSSNNSDIKLRELQITETPRNPKLKQIDCTKFDYS